MNNKLIYHVQKYEFEKNPLNFASYNLLTVVVNTLFFIQIHPTSYVLLNKKTILCAVTQQNLCLPSKMWKKGQIIPQ